MNYPYAKYTMTLYEFDKRNKGWLLELFNTLEGQTPNGETYGQRLYNVFMARWSPYEIIAETEDLFKEYITEDFNLYYNEYKERLDNYYKSYDWTKGNKISHSGTSSNDENSNRSSSSNSTTTSENTTLDYDLPRTAQTENTPNAKVEVNDSSSNDNNTEVNGSSTRSTTWNDTTERSDILLKLKSEYMRQITDLFRDFASRFYDCFFRIY